VVNISYLFKLILQYYQNKHPYFGISPALVKHVKAATILCDNETVINTLNKLKYKKLTPKKFYAADFDILYATSIIAKKLYIHKVLIKFEHIRGHQDKKHKLLTKDAKLNVHALIDWLQSH
jgi:hypothetical protein